jgi:type IV fimbrial biogenesis protein FimT
MNQAREKQSGFTIMELLLTLLIVGILAGIGLPSFNNLIASNKMSSNANEIVGAFNLARSEATQRGTNVNIGSISGGTDWTSGFRIWLDGNDNDAYDAGEEIRVFEAIDSGLTLTSTRVGVYFNAVGFSKFGAGAAGAMTMSLCSAEASVNDRQLDLAASGRISISQFNCP